MAALLTLLAIVAGGVVGLTNGGRIDRILEYRPQLWQALWQAPLSGIALSGGRIVHSRCLED